MDEEKYKKRLEKVKQAKEKQYKKMINRKKSSNSYKRNEALQEVRFSNKSGSYVNHFIFHLQNTSEHEDTKYEVFKALRRKKHDVLVEPIFINGGRCDVLDLTDFVCYEITKTETIEMLEQKREYYPKIFEIKRINANKKFKEEDLL